MIWLGMTPLEIVAAVMSFVGVWLSMRRSLSSWPIIILACLLYGEFFREIHLYSDMALQVVFAVCGVYGWWKWHRGIQDDGAVIVLSMGWRGWVAAVTAGTLGSLLLGYCMAHYVKSASLPWLDSALTAFSLVGQVLQARKYLANWWIWIAVDVFYVGEYIYKHVNLTAGLYAFFVVLAALGLRDWRRALSSQRGIESSRQMQAAR
jgi:nicotinamide mononucleotide transporter